MIGNVDCITNTITRCSVIPVIPVGLGRVHSVPYCVMCIFILRPHGPFVRYRNVLQILADLSIRDRQGPYCNPLKLGNKKKCSACLCFVRLLLLAQSLVGLRIMYSNDGSPTEPTDEVPRYGVDTGSWKYQCFIPYKLRELPCPLGFQGLI